MTAQPDRPAVTGLVPPVTVGEAVRSDPVVRYSAAILCGIVVIASLDLAQVFFAPVFLSVVVGTIFGLPMERLSRLACRAGSRQGGW